MPVYKERVCSVCGGSFIPTSPNHKYCVVCREECKKLAMKAFDIKRNRIRNPTEYTRNCKICGSEFKTYYKHKVYCGSPACEKERVIRNGKGIQARRIEYNRKKAIRRYKEKTKEILLQKAMVYRVDHPDAKEYVYGEKIHNHTYDYIKAYIEDRGYKLLSDSYKNNRSKIKLLCPKGHIWETTFHGFQDRKVGNNIITGARCFDCYVEGGYVSRPEQLVRDYFLINYPEIEVIYNDRKQISPKELDFYFPQQKVAIEVNGLFWHSEEAGRKPDYHYNKMMSCRDKGIRLITLFEDEIYDKFDIVTSIIVEALGLTANTIHANECFVKEISQEVCNDFLDKNHIKGVVASIKSFGLFYKNDLVSVASLNKTNRKNKSSDVIEIKRFCNLLDTNVLGALQKLLRAIKEFSIEEGYKTIKLRCDMRYFDSIDQSVGFLLSSSIKYSPRYVKNGKPYRNILFRKAVNYNTIDKTEFQFRQENGYDRIWDCGYFVYIHQLN